MHHHYTSRGDRIYRYYVCNTAQKRGAAACPGSRVTATEIESFVVDHIRHLATDPEIVTATLEAARREMGSRKPGLVAEARRLEADRQRLDHERRGLLAAIPDAGSAVGTLTARLGEIDDLDARAQERLAEVRGELVALGAQGINEADLRAALAAFDPLWDTLVTRERVRLLRLLIEEIAYDAASGEVAITFRPGGLQALAQRRSA
jgi:site-specific DNA recombinase